MKTFLRRQRTWGNSLMRKAFTAEEKKETPNRTASESTVEQTKSKAVEGAASGEFSSKSN
jgi:hypothetical protein